MKTLRILSLFMLVAVVSKAQVPNGSFENWYTYTNGEYPNGWTTSDSVSQALGGGHSAVKGTDPYNGTYSIHLTSVHTPIGINGPGTATNGTISLSGATFMFNGGTAISTRYRYLTGYFKYTPQNANDSAVVRVYFFADTTGTGTRDTLAVGITHIGGTTSTYTSFMTTMWFNDFGHNPDTCLIILQSSKDINDPNLGIGSEFVVDSLNFTGTVGIEEANDVIKSVNIFPTPAQNQLNINVELKKKVILNCTIFDVNGKQVFSATSIGEKESIDISSLAKGNYILKIYDERANALYARSFVKD